MTLANILQSELRSVSGLWPLTLLNSIVCHKSTLAGANVVVCWLSECTLVTNYILHNVSTHK